jgi:hypothetical protein
MFLGNIGSVEAGETRMFSLSFAALLASGDTIADVSAGITVWPQSQVKDPNAANLLIGIPFSNGSNGFAAVGGAYVAGSSGFQLSAAYSLWMQAITTNGNALRVWGNITVDSVAPPTFSSSGAPAPGEYSQSANFTPAASGTYFVAETGLTAALPSASVGGDILFVDNTGANDPAFNLSGPLLNTGVLTDVLPSGGSFRIRWSALYSRWYIAS